MSWTLMMIRTKTNTEPYYDIEDEKVIPFSKEEIINNVNEISVNTGYAFEDTDTDFIYVRGESWSVEFGFWKELLYSENDSRYYTVELEIRGNTEPREFLYLLTEKLNTRLFDMSADKFWTVDNSGFAEWKDFCMKVAEELLNEKVENT